MADHGGEGEHDPSLLDQLDGVLAKSDRRLTPGRHGRPADDPPDPRPRGADAISDRSREPFSPQHHREQGDPGTQREKPDDRGEEERGGGLSGDRKQGQREDEAPR